MAFSIYHLVSAETSLHQNVGVLPSATATRNDKLLNKIGRKWCFYRKIRSKSTARATTRRSLSLTRMACAALIIFINFSYLQTVRELFEMSQSVVVNILHVCTWKCLNLLLLFYIFVRFFPCKRRMLCSYFWFVIFERPS